jgi:cellulose synthase/poly-beta-1,6-N-acetylglucosamine synthase-like glycosyltransferase
MEEEEGGTSRPWLSVLIPVYGVERYLEACVESVRAQADAGVEIVLLDDASPDRCGQIAAALQERHPHTIRSLAHRRNRGLSAARNSLLDAARGRYVWFLDSDDELLPGAIAELRAIVEADAPDLVLCDFRVLRERRRWRHRLQGESHRRSYLGGMPKLSRDRDMLVKGMLRSRQLHAWSKIATREAWRQAPFPEGRYFEDIAVIPRLVGATRRWCHASRPWVGYRQRDDSILATMDQRKVHDQLVSMRELSRGLSRMPGGLDAEASAAVDYFCMRAFASLARNVSDDDASLDGECRDAIAAIFPDGIARAVEDCRRRGWQLRAWRARRSLALKNWLQ